MPSHPTLLSLCKERIKLFPKKRYQLAKQPMGFYLRKILFQEPYKEVFLHMNSSFYSKFSDRKGQNQQALSLLL